MATELQELVVADAAALRDWLAAGPTDGVWLTLAKKGALAKKGTPATKGALTEKGLAGPTTLTYAEAVDEALCFGWIDGQARRHDEATYFVRFTPRRPRSIWSARNVGLVARLIEEGRMRPEGQAEIDRAKADGRWDAAYAGPATIEMADDLAAALELTPAASAMFGMLTSQNRYAILHRLGQAKRPETRARRIEQFVSMLARGETIYPQKSTRAGQQEQEQDRGQNRT